MPFANDHNRSWVFRLTPEGVGAVAVLAMRSPALPEMLVPLMMTPSQTAAHLLTATQSGALPSRGELAEQARQHPGRAIRIRLTHNAQFIDDGLLFLWPPAPPKSDWRGELHLHGGLHIMERALSALHQAGFNVIDGEPGSFPESALIADESRTPSPDNVPHASLPMIQNRLEEEICRLLLHAPTLRGAAWLSRQLETGLVPAWRNWCAASKSLPPSEVATILNRWLENGVRAEPFFKPTPILLVGPPNAGKSTLFNALLGQPRSIVSEQPGTTRDWVDADAELCGLPVHLFDTAGWRQATDELEALAVQRANQLAAEMSHAVYLILLDGSQAAPPEVFDWITRLAQGRRTWFVRTHADRPPAAWTWPILTSPDRKGGVQTSPASNSGLKGGGLADCRLPTPDCPTNPENRGSVRGFLEVCALDPASVRHLAETVSAEILPADQPADEPAAVGELLQQTMQKALQSADPGCRLRPWIEVF